MQNSMEDPIFHMLEKRMTMWTRLSHQVYMKELTVSGFQAYFLWPQAVGNAKRHRGILTVISSLAAHHPHPSASH